MRHTHTINAYGLKAGGFRGVIRNEETGVITRSDLFPTLSAATFWAKTEAWEATNKQSKLAPLNRCGEYFANVWVAA